MEAGCLTCRHYLGGVLCTAYPKGIPLPILAGDIPHFESLPGYGTIPDDNGIVYEPIEDEEAPYEE